jgi:hypothetical protein
VNEINPAWVSVAIAATTMVGSWIFAARAAKRGTEIALAVMQERQNSQGQNLGRLQDQVTDHAGLLAEHAVRIGVLESRIDGAPADYPRRG